MNPDDCPKFRKHGRHCLCCDNEEVDWVEETIIGGEDGEYNW